MTQAFYLPHLDPCTRSFIACPWEQNGSSYSTALPLLSSYKQRQEKFPYSNFSIIVNCALYVPEKPKTY